MSWKTELLLRETGIQFFIVRQSEGNNENFSNSF